MVKSLHKRRDQPRSAGFAPWVFAGLWVLVGALLGIVILTSATDEPLRDARQEHDRVLIEEFQRKEASTKVVIIGNSKMRYATYEEGLLEKSAHKLGLDIAFLRLLSNNAVFSHFDHALDDVLAQRPDIVVVQAPLLIQEPTVGGSGFRFFQQYVRWRLFGGTIDGVDPLRIQHELICPRDVSDRNLAERRERIERRRVYDAAGANAQVATAFINNARAQGIQVVAVTVPVVGELESYLESRGDGAKIREQALPLAQSSWTFSQALPNDLFCDPIHMAPEGREIYSAWLIERVAEWRDDYHDDILALNPDR